MNTSTSTVATTTNNNTAVDQVIMPNNNSMPSSISPIVSFFEAAWTLLSQDVLRPICWVCSCLLLLFLLICYRWKPRYIRIARGAISIPMLAFLLNHLANSLIFIFSQFIINPIVAANPTINSSNWLNTWWSFWVGNYLLVMPINIFFLVMDRLFALILAVRYTKVQQKRFGRLCLFTLFSVYAFSLLDVLIAWPYSQMCNAPGTENNPIGNRPCLPLLNRIVNFSYQFIKIVFAILNIILSAIFLYKLHLAAIYNVKNGVVKMTIICELIFDAIPSLISLFFSIANIQINLNDYTFLMASMDATICSICYAIIMFNRKWAEVNAAATKLFHSTSRLQQNPKTAMGISSVNPEIIHRNNSISINRRGTFASQH